MAFHTQTQKTIAGLRTLLLTPTQPAKGIVCLLHGYGASAENLRALAEKTTAPVIVAIPDGCIERHPGENTEAFAWWPIDLDRLLQERQHAQANRSLHLLYDAKPIGLPKARAHILSWLNELARLFGHRDFSRFVLGGFSQGAMLATDVTLHVPTPCAGLGIFSGALINRHEWEMQQTKVPATPRFQSHGNQDPILLFDMGKALHHFLQKGPLQGEFFAFAGGHEIPTTAISRWNQHITTWLS